MRVSKIIRYNREKINMRYIQVSEQMTYSRLTGSTGNHNLGSPFSLRQRGEAKGRQRDTCSSDGELGGLGECIAAVQPSEKSRRRCDDGTLLRHGRGGERRGGTEKEGKEDSGTEHGAARRYEII